VFNATGPVPPVSMVDVVEAASAAAGADLTVRVVPDATATALGLGFQDLPLWLDEPDWAAWAEVVVSRALAAGLRFRPLADTVAATLHEAEVVEGWGLTAERERELLDAAGVG
jgi:2'-hydroxyisoflavone reductase